MSVPETTVTISDKALRGIYLALDLVDSIDSFQDYGSDEDKDLIREVSLFYQRAGAQMLKEHPAT